MSDSRKIKDLMTSSLPSGKHTKTYGTSPFLIEKSTISMAIFNSYVKLPEWYHNIMIGLPEFTPCYAGWTPKHALSLSQLLYQAASFNIPIILSYHWNQLFGGKCPLCIYIYIWIIHEYPQLIPVIYIYIWITYNNSMIVPQSNSHHCGFSVRSL